jgi:hypothetical protein
MSKVDNSVAVGILEDMKTKDPAAVSLGRKGGLARAKKTPAKKLSAIGRKGARARWKKSEK